MARELCQTKSRVGIAATGFCYSDIVPSGNPSIQSHLVHQLEGYASNSGMLNMSAAMDMTVFSQNQQQQNTDGNTAIWKTLLGKHGSQPWSSSSKLMPESIADCYQHDQSNKAGQFSAAEISGANAGNLIVSPLDPATWQENRLLVDDSSIRCVFPCEGNQRPSQGLSLSLSPSNPSGIGLQSFGIRHANRHDDQHDVVSSSSGDHQSFYGRSGNTHQHQQLLIQQEGCAAKPAANLYQGHFFLKDTKYLVPAQELLSEFCSLGTKQTDQQKQKLHKNKQSEEETDGFRSRKKSLSSLEFVELQRRKSKLLSMLEEVDRRYMHYSNQMRVVVSSFEAVAGNGAATVYSALASKAMSRHFRSLKDGILSQINSTRQAMGEKDPITPGTTRGETPRLRVIDQTLRQQRGFQQMSMMESHPWRPQRGLPERSVSVLRAWLFEHFLHPYPSDVDKHILARQTGLSRSQVSNWFINARVRLWKPMVEEMYLEETKEQGNMLSSDEFTTDVEDKGRPIRIPPSAGLEDRKPTPDQLLRVDSDCLSSIVNSNPDHNNNSRPSCDVLPPPHLRTGQHQSQLERVGDCTYGSVLELDFTSYNQQSGPIVSYGTESANHSLNGGGGVSLTLGLQQHGGSGVSLAFTPATQNSLFYPREHVEECQPVQYPLLDGEAPNLPYRNLMGAQLLNDLAG